jgi:GT2 family glycosyltransferase
MPSTIVFSGHGNIGYGKGNNLAIHKCKSDYHLVLNPDVELAADSIYEALKFLLENKDVAMIAPHATNQFGEYEYLAKRMPSLSVILIRGLNKAFLNKIFKARLEKYAYKDRIPSSSPMDIELASGCFMFCRTSQLKSINGFCEEYFLYFEDFDLSKRIAKLGRIVYLPNVKIIHHGGMAARKGWKHIKLFFSSYWIFKKKKYAIN